MKRLRIFDTTLRDGEQGIGYLMNIEQKSAILNDLNQLDLDVIELGFPAASQTDFDWIREASFCRLKATPSILSRFSNNDTRKVIDSARNFTNYQIQFLGVGSELHLKNKRKITLEAHLEEIKKNTRLVMAEGIQDVAIILEDATRGSYEMLKRIIDTSLECGVTTVTIADTLGCMIPYEIDRLFTLLQSSFGYFNLGVHCHNDLGLATINTLTACKAGASEIQTTMGGIGERAGNCALEEIIAILMYKNNYYKFTTNIHPLQLNRVCQAIFSKLNKKIPENKPIIGQNVFSTAAGLHQDGLLKNRKNYQYIVPEQFGRSLDFVINRLSSKKVRDFCLAKKEAV